MRQLRILCDIVQILRENLPLSDSDRGRFCLRLQLPDTALKEDATAALLQSSSATEVSPDLSKRWQNTSQAVSKRPEVPPDLSKRWQNTSQAVSKRPHFLSKRLQSLEKVPTEQMETLTEGEPVFPFYNMDGSLVCVARNT